MDWKRRRSQRINLDWTVSMESSLGMHGGSLKNLSLHGIFIKTVESVPVGESVSVSFREPGVSWPRSLLLGAVVVRSEPEGVALDLRQMDLDTLIMLRSIVGGRVAEA